RVVEAAPGVDQHRAALGAGEGPPTPLAVAAGMEELLTLQNQPAVGIAGVVTEQVERRCGAPPDAQAGARPRLAGEVVEEPLDRGGGRVEALPDDAPAGGERPQAAEVPADEGVEGVGIDGV